MRHTPLAERGGIALAALHDLPAVRLEGRVAGVSGLAVEVGGLSHHLSVGDRIALLSRHGHDVPAEIVGFRGGLAQAMTYGPAEGLGPGSAALAALPTAGAAHGAALAVSDGWIGRIIDPLGRPLDGRGKLPHGPALMPVRAPPPPAIRRARLG